MSKICQVTAKRPQSGNRVSHAHNKTKHRFLPNLHRVRLWFEEEKRWLRLKVSKQGLRTIEKKGLANVVAGMRKRGIKV